MNLGLEGARVLVTAGASGIGLATAREFVREGARVHVCDVDARALTALSVNDPTLSHSQCDVSDESSVRQLFDDMHRAARRPRRAGQQRRYRRADGTL